MPGSSKQPFFRGRLPDTDQSAASSSLISSLCAGPKSEYLVGSEDDLVGLAFGPCAELTPFERFGLISWLMQRYRLS